MPADTDTAQDAAWTLERIERQLEQIHADLPAVTLGRNAESTAKTLESIDYKLLELQRALNSIKWIVGIGVWSGVLALLFK